MSASPSPDRLIPSGYWIVSSRSDLALILLTPIALVPLFLVGTQPGWTEPTLIFFGMLAMGHYLPGMMRAYGDRELFRRFRVRLIVAPIGLIAICGTFAHLDVRSVLFMLAMWGGWHWMMQIYGFARIYDAKAGAVARSTARLDYLLCILLYVSCILLTGTLDGLLRAFYQSGGPLVSPSILDVAQSAWLGSTAVVIVFYVANTVRSARRGNPLNPLKLVIMGVGFPFLAYTLTLVQTPMIGVLMFESFHDIQYLTLVWAFNRGRVEKGAGAGSFLHFLFRKRAALVLLYVAMCLSFGSWDFVARSVIGDEAVLKVVLSFVSAMAFFHYYLDGFIWKLREPQTQQSLEVTAQPIEPWSPAARVRQLVTAKWVPQAAMWSILFLAPMGLLGAAQGRLSPASAIQSELSLAAAFGDNPAPQLELCKLFYTARDFPAASSHCQRALELSPGWFAASNNLAASLHRMGRPGEAVPFYRKALLRQPDDPEVRQNLALALQQLEDPAAQLHFEAAIALDPHGPKRSTSYYQLGRIHRRDDRLDLAEDHFRNAVRLDERRSAAHHSLAAVLALRGDLDEAVEHFERALELDPERAQVHLNLARLLLRLDRPDEAEAHFQRARRARARSQRTKPEDPRTEPDA